MVRTRGGLRFQLKVRLSTPAGADTPYPEVAAAAVPSPASADVAAVVLNLAADGATVGTQAADPPSRKYNTRVGPVPPSPEHPRPPRRAPPSKRAQTSGPRESSRSKLVPS